MARNRIKSLEESESYLRREYEDALAKIAILQDEVVALRGSGGSSQSRPPATRLGRRPPATLLPLTPSSPSPTCAWQWLECPPSGVVATVWLRAFGWLPAVCSLPTLQTLLTPPPPPLLPQRPLSPGLPPARVRVRVQAAAP